MKRNKQLYPGCTDAEKERIAAAIRATYETSQKPDFIGGKPNYDKFPGWNAEKILVWLNID